MATIIVEVPPGQHQHAAWDIGDGGTRIEVRGTNVDPIPVLPPNLAEALFHRHTALLSELTVNGAAIEGAFASALVAWLTRGAAARVLRLGNGTTYDAAHLTDAVTAADQLDAVYGLAYRDDVMVGGLPRPPRSSRPRVVDVRLEGPCDTVWDWIARNDRLEHLHVRLPADARWMADAAAGDRRILPFLSVRFDRSRDGAWPLPPAKYTLLELHASAPSAVLFDRFVRPALAALRRPAQDTLAVAYRTDAGWTDGLLHRIALCDDLPNADALWVLPWIGDGVAGGRAHMRAAADTLFTAVFAAARRNQHARMVANLKRVRVAIVPRDRHQRRRVMLRLFPFTPYDGVLPSDP